MSVRLWSGLNLNGWGGCCRRRNPSVSHTLTTHGRFLCLPPIYCSISSSRSTADGDDGNENAKHCGAVVSGTTARGRRLLRVREEKRKREYDRVHNYPAWAKYSFVSFLPCFLFTRTRAPRVWLECLSICLLLLSYLRMCSHDLRIIEEACQNDEELRAILGDSIGQPELMKKRIQERIRTKGRDFSNSKTGSILAFKVSFRGFNPLDSYVWFQLYGSPSDRDVDLIGNVIQSWYLMGRLGAFNSSNLQLANASMDYNPLYDAESGFKVMPASFHEVSDVEFQDNWGRFWVDLGTTDYFSIDVLLNCLTALSSEYVGIQQVVFGGRQMGDWEEGMTDPEDGYKHFKI